MAEDQVRDTWKTPRERASKPFEARFPGTCTGCNWEIEPGDQIVMFRGEAYHDDDECLSKG